jgi:hypothetical protein
VLMQVLIKKAGAIFSFNNRNIGLKPHRNLKKKR